MKLINSGSLAASPKMEATQMENHLIVVGIRFGLMDNGLGQKIGKLRYNYFKIDIFET